jgi:hypothetical protein
MIMEYTPGNDRNGQSWLILTVYRVEVTAFCAFGRPPLTCLCVNPMLNAAWVSC